MKDNREHAEATTSNDAWQGKSSQDLTHARVHDIVCIGFGCSAISLAIALDETCHDADVLFLERQPRSTYVPFNRLPGSFMQLSFLNDLVTLENPRSRFSYVNYLHSTDQLIQFTNLGYLQPLREQFSRYLNWCADSFTSKARYGSEVRAVKPVRTYGSSVDAWDVEYVDVETGRPETVLTKQIVYAGGPQMHVPSVLSDSDIADSVMHSSDCIDLLSALSKDSANQRHVAVVGNGQEAAETVEKICGMQNPHTVTWIRESSIERAGAVDQALSDHLYELQYSQRVCEPDRRKWKLQAHSDIDIKSAGRNAEGKIQLSYTGLSTESGSAGIICDFVIAATGYTDFEYRRLLEPAREALYGDTLTVNQRRGVDLKPDAVQLDCGIWMLGSTEHGDKTLAQLAAMTRFLADSITKKLRRQFAGWQQVQPRL